MLLSVSSIRMVSGNAPKRFLRLYNTDLHSSRKTPTAQFFPEVRPFSRAHQKRLAVPKGGAILPWSFIRKFSTTPIATHIDEESLIKQEKQNKKISIWLYFCAGLVFLMVVVGGITRLTESGLSIVDWRPVTGTVPPMSDQEWEIEFKKYRSSPEFQKLNPNMQMEEFKKIFYMEWFHRFLGRTVGVVFALPFAYFAAKGWVNKSLGTKLAILFGMGGLQGFIGWWMVKSGLEEGQDHPRVSPVRLATHLGSAFIIYLGLFWTAMSLSTPLRVLSTPSVLTPIPSAVKHLAHGAAGLTFLTAMSGAIVAGLDAGLLYPEIPYMGDTLVPKEYWELSPPRKNFTENGATAQFNHRVLATSTWVFIVSFWLYARRFSLPPRARLALNSLFGMAHLQVALGIGTLLYHVPIPLAAAHQSGSLTLLTIATWLMYHLKRIPKIR